MTDRLRHMPGDTTARSGAARGFALTLASLATLLVVTLYAQLPLPSLLPSLRGEEPTFAGIWPQGWSFFAAEPDAEVYFVYRLAADGRYVAVTLPLMSASSQWGLGRSSEVYYEESHYLAPLIPRASWETCSDPFEKSCISRAKTTKLVNDFSPAVLCGLVVFVSGTLAEVTSGAHDLASPERVALADVTCAG